MLEGAEAEAEAEAEEEDDDEEEATEDEEIGEGIEGESAPRLPGGGRAES